MIEYKSVSKIYNGDVIAVDDVDLQINENLLKQKKLIFEELFYIKFKITAKLNIKL